MSGFRRCPRCDRRGVSIRWLNPRIRRVRCRYCHQTNEYDAATWPGEEAAVASLMDSTHTVPPGSQARRKVPIIRGPDADR